MTSTHSRWGGLSHLFFKRGKSPKGESFQSFQSFEEQDGVDTESKRKTLHTRTQDLGRTQDLTHTQETHTLESTFPPRIPISSKKEKLPPLNWADIEDDDSKTLGLKFSKTRIFQGFHRRASSRAKELHEVQTQEHSHPSIVKEESSSSKNVPAILDVTYLVQRRTEGSRRGSNASRSISERRNTSCVTPVEADTQQETAAGETTQGKETADATKGKETAAVETTNGKKTADATKGKETAAGEKIKGKETAAGETIKGKETAAGETIKGKETATVAGTRESRDERKTAVTAGAGLKFIGEETGTVVAKETTLGKETGMVQTGSVKVGGLKKDCKTYSVCEMLEYGKSSLVLRSDTSCSSAEFELLETANKTFSGVLLKKSDGPMVRTSFVASRLKEIETLGRGRLKDLTHTKQVETFTIGRPRETRKHQTTTNHPMPSPPVMHAPLKLSPNLPEASPPPLPPPPSESWMTIAPYTSTFSWTPTSNHQLLMMPPPSWLPPQPCPWMWLPPPQFFNSPPRIPPPPPYPPPPPDADDCVDKKARATRRDYTRSQSYHKRREDHTQRTRGGRVHSHHPRKRMMPVSPTVRDKRALVIMNLLTTAAPPRPTEDDKLPDTTVRVDAQMILPNSESTSATETSPNDTFDIPEKYLGRARQVARGKATPEYSLYLLHVPRNERGPGDPVTPRVCEGSYKRFNIAVLKWKKAVYDRCDDIIAHIVS